MKFSTLGTDTKHMKLEFNIFYLTFESPEDYQGYSPSLGSQSTFHLGAETVSDTARTSPDRPRL